MAELIVRHGSLRRKGTDGQFRHRSHHGGHSGSAGIHRPRQND
jgi:hypothetical protein